MANCIKCKERIRGDIYPIFIQKKKFRRFWRTEYSYCEQCGELANQYFKLWKTDELILFRSLVNG